MRRYELTDEQWEAIAPLLPSATTDRPRRDDRTTLNGVFWKLCSGAAWRDVPERYGHFRTVYDRFAKYRDDGTSTESSVHCGSSLTPRDTLTGRRG